MQLNHIKALIPRSEDRAAPLQQLIQSEGGRACICPVMQIQPLYPEIGVADLEWADVVLVMSVNAVSALAAHHVLLEHKRVIAVGDATANGLRASAIEVSDVPQQASSEGVLSLPSMQRVASMSVVIVSGADPRPFLAQQLQQRGAAVRSVAVYQRVKAHWTLHEHCDCIQRFESAQINLIVFYSVSQVGFFLEILQKKHLSCLSDVACVAISDRIAACCRELHCFKHVYVAAGPSDQQVCKRLRAINKELAS